MDLEQLMQENWKKLKPKFFFPDLPPPKVTNGKGTAAIDMISHQIYLNQPFVEHLNQKGIDLDVIVNGLLAHEINHYTTCPFDLVRSLLIQRYAHKVDERVGQLASSLYMDVVVNLDLVLKKKIDTVLPLLKEGEDNPLSRVMKSYYQWATKYDMDVELDDFQKSQLDRLKTIDFFNNNDRRNVTRFTRVVRDITQHYKMEEPEYVVLGKFDNEAYTKDEMEKALKDLAKILEKDEFDSIVKILMEGPGPKPGDQDGNPEDRDILFYQKLADNYKVGIKKRQVEENGALYPHSHKDFEIDDSPQDIDPYASFGKPFIPGLGKSWVRKAGVHYAEKKDTPNVMIMRDISISMGACEPQAEVACVATANAYLENDSAVGVYLFNTKIDEEELEKGYQTNKNEIHRALVKSNSGGTEIKKQDLQKLDDMLQASEKDVDIVLVTDLEITGREELFKYLHDNQNRNRVTIIYTGHNGGIQELKEKYNDDSFAIYQISNPDDIPNIVIGEVNKSL